jgi:hypothetical protein
METMYFMRLVLETYKYEWRTAVRDPRVKAWSNNSTATLRVVEGDENGSLESEPVKYGHQSYGIGPENHCAGEDQQQL